MTPATRRHWQDSCHKLAMVSTGIQLGSYQPIDLLCQAEVHLLMLEGFRNLLAVAVEGAGGEVEWTTDGSGIL